MEKFGEIIGDDGGGCCSGVKEFHFFSLLANSSYLPRNIESETTHEEAYSLPGLAQNQRRYNCKKKKKKKRIHTYKEEPGGYPDKVSRAPEHLESSRSINHPHTFPTNQPEKGGKERKREIEIER